MRDAPRSIGLEEWDRRHAALARAGHQEPWYGGHLSRHVERGDNRLTRLKYDNSTASLRLWNFFLTEEERLHRARGEGQVIVGAMKDLGTVPVLAYAFPNVTAFYPDGAWWTPCIMEMSSGVLACADSLGVGESFCPVRAMLGAFVLENHFPIPDLLTCSVGATCDDFSAIAQRLEGMGHDIFWWEIPHRRRPGRDEKGVDLPGGVQAPREQVRWVRSELCRVKKELERVSGRELGVRALADGIRRANRVRGLLGEIRRLAFEANPCPLPALELMIAEMLAIHFCSDREEATEVLTGLRDETLRRVRARQGTLPEDAVRVFWVNPTADIQAMNMLEECGGRLCGSDFMFSHALDPIPEDMEPMEALARTALADPMVGPAGDRAERICRDIRRFGSEAVVISRIPGASHCAVESLIVGDLVRETAGVPVLAVEVPPVNDAFSQTLKGRLEALMETARERRKS